MSNQNTADGSGKWPGSEDVGAIQLHANPGRFNSLMDAVREALQKVAADFAAADSDAAVEAPAADEVLITWSVKRATLTTPAPVYETVDITSDDLKDTARIVVAVGPEALNDPAWTEKADLWACRIQEEEQQR